MNIFELSPSPEFNAFNRALQKAQSKLIGDVSRNEIRSHIHRAITDAGYDIDVTIVETGDQPRDTVGVNGYYDDAADADGETAIELALVFHPDSQVISDMGSKWRELSVLLTDTWAHETIHVRQSTKRGWIPQRGTNPKHLPDHAAAAYLGNPDEVEAFAHNIASELLSTMSKVEALEFIKGRHTLDELKAASVDLFGYYEAFGSTDWSAMRKLLRKVTVYLEQM